MNRILIIVAFLGVFMFSPSANGQSVAPSMADKAAIANLWNEVAEAVRKKDRTALERIYSPDFVHVHAKGKIDGRSERLDTILSGATTIDVGGEIDLGFRRYGETLIAVGTVKTTGDDGKPVTYAVTRIHSREKGRWSYVSSHASAVVQN